MAQAQWRELRFPPASDEDHIWEVFHENSKVTRYGHHLPDQRVAGRMIRMAESFAYDGYPAVELPAPFDDLDVRLDQAIVDRVTPSAIEPVPLDLAQLSTILFAGAGVTRRNDTTAFLRPFRTAPSGGALYPLEIYLSTKHVEGLPAGVHHYHPTDHHLRRLRSGDLSGELAGVFVEFQADLAFDASLVVMITGVFGRSTFKYGARGYRFALLEAGHVAQNMNLAATGLGLGCINIGGFYDRAADEFLGLDGLGQGTIYLLAIGAKAGIHEAPSILPSAEPPPTAQP